jgi:hypothetical protein
MGGLLRRDLEEELESERRNAIHYRLRDLEYSERKANMLLSEIMAVRSCRVTIQDLEGVAHTVEVTAESLYEAVAQGLAALRRSDWVHGFQQGIVKVSVADVRVEHQVRLADFTQWLEKPGAKSPREMIQRQRLRSILGMPGHVK